ncbi:GPO family capsid scaffolding protein [Pseudomonas jilinensis]|uniref:Phage capsid protein n=1 Tax=Pseudomonas jilinensis TaxID=2078689 RepID=A0A396S4R4_9PSED|nr:GPO family capsid scaffolding protein [Pseudomonas jilinensis]RHW21683.1 phage capsid protein [Pseudomonas jilinensis]
MPKFKSKWVRVAVEGMTTDGRQIERSWIEEMAETYDRSKYGARVWLEHYRGVLPDSPFKAYGDVLAAKAEEIDMDGKKKLALFVQLDPTDDLVSMNKAKQKIFTSIEVREKFADSGKAYLMGLAVTDTPASLGTEVLQFSAKNPAASPFIGRKEHPDNLFSEALEAELEFEEVDDNPGKLQKLFTRVNDLLKSGKDKSVKDDATFADIHAAVEALAGHCAESAQSFSQLQNEVADLKEQLQPAADLRNEFNELKQQLENTPNQHHRQRPPATGGDGQIVTDC